MKKVILMGAAVASLGLFASCSSDDDLSAGGNGDNGLQQIKIGMGVQANVGTRGTGTVGAVGAAENVWAKQLVNVYMLNRGTLDVAQFDGADIYANTEFTTPDAATSGIASELNDGVAQYKYYPVQGSYDFWGYRLDDANNATGTDQTGDDTHVAIEGSKYVPYTNGDSLLIGFQIDGSQDVMAGKAVPTAEEIATCTSEENIYSSYAARRGVQPNIKFDHLLSQLNFQVLAGAESTTNTETGVRVTGIKVHSKNTGKLVIAYMNDATFENVTDQLIPDEVEEGTVLPALEVKQRKAGATNNENLEALQPVLPKWNNGVALATEVGTGLLAIPADEYEIEIDLKQKVLVKGDKSAPTDGDYEEKNFTYKATLKNTIAPEDGFKAGYSYNVTITIYGLSQIELTTTLSPWKDGGNIEMNPEDNFFGDANSNKNWEFKEITVTDESGLEIITENTWNLDSINKYVAANASNAGKIYKVGNDPDYKYYQCVVKVTTPAPATPTYGFELVASLGESESAAATYETKEELDDAHVLTADNLGKIYAVGTEGSYQYYKVVAKTSTSTGGGDIIPSTPSTGTDGE